MAKNKKSFMDTMSDLAGISDMIEQLDFFEGNSTVHFSLSRDKYQKLLNHFREIDRNKEKFIISISDIDFIFSLKK